MVAIHPVMVYKVEVTKKDYAPFPKLLQTLVKGFGGAFATDHISVDGLPVRWMYREEPNSNDDSGWRFFSGYETDEFANTPKNADFFDLNTIANWDPTIVPLLDREPRVAFEKPLDSDQFIEVPDYDFPEDCNGIE